MDYRVQLIITVMKDDLHRDTSLRAVAQSVGLSLSHFHSLFKAETNVSPAQYLRSLRMARAKELLTTTLLSVKEIMVKVGIKDKSHFEREFKRRYGLTPAQYRVAAQIASSAKKEVRGS